MQNNKLIITPQDLNPIEISNGGVIINRRGMDTTHEEADIFIMQQMLMVAIGNPTTITILSDDTDVFVLLL